MLIPKISEEDLELDGAGTELAINTNHVDFDEIEDVEAFLPEYKSPSMHFVDIENYKEFKKFILKIERMARQSDELKRYINYLSSELDMDKCSLLDSVNKENASIEIHHYPFTLYDITEIVIRENLRLNKGFTTFSLAKEVVEVHYKNLVGLVPLSKTVHELAHAGEVFINLKRVFGDIGKFVSIYKHSISNDHLDLIDNIIDISLKDTSEKRNNILLQINRFQWAIGEGTGANLTETLLLDSPTNEENDNVLEEEGTDPTVE